jgi:protein phosphatase 1 regulatory subunit 11
VLGSYFMLLIIYVCLTRLIVCCIYHAPKAFGESSDESSSDSDDSDSGDDGSARPTRRPSHGHGHGHGHGHSHGKGKGKGRSTSPNAYEKMPRNKKGGMK